jgi:hypothetical protein
MGTAGLDATKKAELLQHSVSLDSSILDNQEMSGTKPLGWRSDKNDANSLMNTESMAVGALALGARANSVFEPGVAPMTNDANNYFVRPYHALSAVTGLSQAGKMTAGPGFRAPAGTYQVDFLLRAPQPTGTVATVDVYDAVSNTVLASHDVGANEMATGNQWTMITLSAVTVPAGCNRIELRTTWPGTANLDVGPIRVR